VDQQPFTIGMTTSCSLQRWGATHFLAVKARLRLVLRAVWPYLHAAAGAAPNRRMNPCTKKSLVSAARWEQRWLGPQPFTYFNTAHE